MRVLQSSVAEAAVATPSSDDSLIELLLESDIFDPEYYIRQVPELEGHSRAEMVRHFLTLGEEGGLSPTLYFDADFYCRTYPDLANAESMFGHYIAYGHAEGRHGTLASFLIKEHLDVVAIEDKLIPDPGCARGSPDYLRALIDAIAAGEADQAYFSSESYLRMYPDLRNASAPPLIHYLRYGRREGRRSNLDILDAMTFNDRVVHPARPYVMVVVHECSRTGAPRVGLDLALELSKQYNVIFVALDEGPLLNIAEYHFPVTVRATKNPQEALFIYETLMDLCAFDRAIFSSVACEPFLRGLAETDVQLICLVHEFREDYFWVERSIVTFCDLLVFSSRQLLASWANLILEVGRPTLRSLVLPQPPSGDSARRLSKAEARGEVERLTGLDLEGASLVLGAGLVQIRKGTDIFLQVATDLRRKRRRYVCVWIGKQIHEQDGAFGVWLHVHIDRSRDSAGRAAVHFEAPGPLYNVLMDAADVFVVPSRLDPLPNVALDAAARSTPVIAFAGATGLSDISELGRMSLVEVEYGSVEEMVEAIERTTSPRRTRPGWLGGRGEKEAAVPTPAWTYDSYARAILDSADTVRPVLFGDADQMVDSDYTGPVMRTRFDPFVNDAEKMSSINLTRRALRMGVATVNPRPGVHSSRDDSGALTSYRSVWSQERKIEYWPSNAIVHIHAYYPDVLDDIFQRFARTARDARIVVTTTSEAKAADVRAAADQAGMTNIELIICANSGRDIGPFIDHMSPLCSDDEIVCHIHTKKSPEAGDWFGEKWRDNMFRSILSQPALDLFDDPEVGLVIPDNPRNNGWGKNWDEASRLAAHWKRSLPLHPGPFPIGNMFWVRGRVLAAMRDATCDSHWPHEPVPVDGTVLHAIERLWPMACDVAGSKLAAIYAHVRRGREPEADQRLQGSARADAEAGRRRRERFLSLLAAAGDSQV